MSRNPRFRRLRLRNWKNFLQVDVAVGNRLFLVGANAAGKSNFLDAFRFLRDVALSGNGFREAVLHPRRGGVAGIRCLAARRNPDVEITVDLEGEGGVSWRYEIAFHQDNRRRPRIRRERVSRSGEALVDRPNEEDVADPERLTQTYLEQVSVNQPFRDLAAFSPDLLRDEGIGLDETMLLVPGAEGTEVVPAGSDREVRALLEGGLSLADVAIPRTRPENAAQLALFGDF